MTEIAVTVEGVWKKFRLYHDRNQYLKAAVTRGRGSQFEDFWALRDVSFEVKQGQTFGIIGSNGSGKSTLLKCLAGILIPDQGQVATTGRTSALLELGAGFHPDLSGRENVSLNGAILGMSRREIERKFDDIVSFAGLEQFVDTPVKNYSSGMVVRLGFAVAINVQPEVLIIDEVLAVGDEEFQQRCFEKIEDFRRDGRTIIFVSHGLSQVSQLCETAIWLDKGVIRSIDTSYKVVSEYMIESHQLASPAEEPTEESESTPQRDEIPAELENRWGSGEVRITNVSIFDQSQQTTLNLKSGQPASIQVDFALHKPVNEIVVGVRVTNLHGITMWGSNTKRRDHTVRFDANRGSVRFEIESLPLLEGTFDLTVAISDRTEVSPYDHRENLIRFNVHQLGTYDEGLVRFDGEWVN